MHRIEKDEYPLAAIHENVVECFGASKLYGTPVQIRVYDEKISIWNEGVLPAGLTIDALKRSHVSKPRNPVIADVAFKGGYIDAWDRGSIKILDACKSAGLPEPGIQEVDGGFNVGVLSLTYPSVNAFSDSEITQNYFAPLNFWMLNYENPGY